ncbi:MAG: hypothetical protein IKR25_05815 [Muribaculaceae bacterium]|nr:hypothetical protein [Muribaculaceae bacterium]
MDVKVNRTIISVPEGYKVRDVVLAYAARRNVSKARLKFLRVYDAMGEDIDLDDPLSDGDSIRCVL